VLGVHQVRADAIATLQAWLPTALVDVARQTGIDETFVEFPRSWRRVASWDSVAEDQQPLVFATSPGTTATSGARANTGRRRSSEWFAEWEVPILAAARGQDYDQTADLVSVYATAIRAVLVQRPPSLDGVRWWWTAEQFDALPAEQQRTWGGVVVTFVASADRVMVDYPTFDAPPDDPYATAPARPTVEQTGIDSEEQ
jgi:hypothetical protein